MEEPLKWTLKGAELAAEDHWGELNSGNSAHQSDKINHVQTRHWPGRYYFVFLCWVYFILFFVYCAEFENLFILMKFNFFLMIYCTADILMERVAAATHLLSIFNCDNMMKCPYHRPSYFQTNCLGPICQSCLLLLSLTLDPDCHWSKHPYRLPARR